MREVSAGRDSEREVRQRLLASATELFAKKGYAATTVREIVTAAGVTPPVLYYYFRNKEGIFLELMREAWGTFDSVLAEALGEGGTAREKLLHVSEQILALFREKIDAARVMYAVYYGPPQGAPFFDFDTYHTKFREAILALVKEGVAAGDFEAPNPEAVMWALLGAVNIAMEAELSHPELSPGSAGLGRMLEIIFRGTAPRSPEGRRVA